MDGTLGHGKNAITGPQKLKHLKEFDVPNVIYHLLIWC